MSSYKKCPNREVLLVRLRARDTNKTKDKNIAPFNLKNDVCYNQLFTHFHLFLTSQTRDKKERENMIKRFIVRTKLQFLNTFPGKFQGKDFVACYEF